MIRRQKSSRQVGVCGSALERAPVPRKTSRIRRSRSRRLKRPLAPARRSAAVCGGLGSRAKKEPKKAYRDFQAIRRKGVVQGQSRQALMSWRKAEASQLASATSPQASQQPAGCQAKPATARARGVPKPKKSAARLAKDRRRLNLKHLASKTWACVRVASRLLAWSVRARTRCANRGSSRLFGSTEQAQLNNFVQRAASLGLREAAAATGYGGLVEPPRPATGPL